jgi:hypothetical protein
MSTDTCRCLADYYEEAGEPERARYTRLMVEARGAHHVSQQYEAAHALLNQHPEWKAPVFRLLHAGVDTAWRAGTIAVVASYDAFLDAAPAIARCGWPVDYCGLLNANPAPVDGVWRWIPGDGDRPLDVMRSVVPACLCPEPRAYPTHGAAYHALSYACCAYLVSLTEDSPHAPPPRHAPQGLRA